MKRKILALVFALLLVVPFAGCQNKKDDKVLRVAMECAYAPYNWSQADDSHGALPIKGGSGYAYGYDIMMAKLIAEKLGYTLEIHKIEWGALTTALQSDTVDCVIAGQSITAERLQTVDFSKPYYYASIVVLTRKDSEFADAKGISELAGAKATSQINTVWYNKCLPQIEDAEVLPAMDEVPAMMVSLNSGIIDLVVTDEPTAMAACAAYPDLKMLDFTGTDDNFEVSDEDINISISVKKGNSELLDKINSVLDDLTIEDYKRMMSEAISVQPLSE